MKLALLTNDNRDAHRCYSEEVPRFGTAPEALLQGFARRSDIEVHVVSCTQQPMKSPAKLAENIYYHSVHVPKLGWMRTLYQGCVRATRRKLREIGPDLVHGQGTERDCSISAVLSGFPSVVTIHGNMAALARQFHARPGSFHWLAARVENWTLPQTLGVFCNSTYTEAQVQSRNPHTWLVPNALREAFFSPHPIHPVNDRPPRLVVVGTVAPYKRQREILAMCRRLAARGLSFRIEFLGLADAGDPYAAAFLRDLREPGTEAWASFTGFRQLADLIKAFDQADACVHFPSEEAFGLVAAEALARNLKFFGSRTGGLLDIAPKVEGAELFTGDDWPALGDALARWMEKGAPRPASAAVVMRERYHPSVIAERHLVIYGEVLGNL